MAKMQKVACLKRLQLRFASVCIQIARCQSLPFKRPWRWHGLRFRHLRYEMQRSKKPNASRGLVMFVARLSFWVCQTSDLLHTKDLGTIARKEALLILGLAIHLCMDVLSQNEKKNQVDLVKAHTYHCHLVLSGLASAH